MNKILYFILIGLINVSCQKNNISLEYESIDHLKDIVLEITDRSGVSGKSDIFNAYIYAVRFNSDGTYDLLDDLYGRSDYWMSRNSNAHWSFINDQIVFETSPNENLVWEILVINKNQLIIRETTIFDKIISQHTIKISTKQEVE